MKTNLTSASLGACAAAIAVLAITAESDQPEVPPVPPAPPTVEQRLTPVANAEQYKIISLSAVQNEREIQRTEELLNKLSAEGWRVKTGVGAAVVLSR